MTEQTPAQRMAKIEAQRRQGNVSSYDGVWLFDRCREQEAEIERLKLAKENLAANCAAYREEAAQLRNRSREFRGCLPDCECSECMHDD